MRMWRGEKQVDFDEEGRKLFAALGLDAQQRARYNDLDPIFKHEKTAAQIFVGNESAARSGEVLGKHGITRVVNCAYGMPNYHEGKEGFKYLNFNITSWMSEMPKNFSEQDIVNFPEPMLEFVYEGIENGESCLVHCLAGAHRAGTTAVIIIMNKLGMPYHEALRTAKMVRPVINPIGNLKLFAELYSKAIANGFSPKKIVADKENDVNKQSSSTEKDTEE